MKEPNQTFRIEPRWPVVLTILAVLFLLAALPARVRLFQNWIPFVAGIIILAPMVIVAQSAEKARWLRIECIITLLFIVVAEVGTLVILAYLVHTMIYRPGEIDGLQLLASSIAIWITNVLTFSLLYWQMDCGDPEARVNNNNTKPDLLFPQKGVPDNVSPDWHPTFVDYLFLAFSTATAFSTTDVAPLTSCAKIRMMLESSVSLVTLVVVASRAINILGI